MRTISTDILDEVVARLVREFDPDGILLFGSHAWGQPDAGSDLDLLVIVPESDERPPRRATRAHRCLRGLDVPVDVLVRTRSEIDRVARVPASLEADILDRGSLLYGRGETRTGPGLAPEGGP